MQLLHNKWKLEWSAATGELHCYSSSELVTCITWSVCSVGVTGCWCSVTSTVILWQLPPTTHRVHTNVRRLSRADPVTLSLVFGSLSRCYWRRVASQPVTSVVVILRGVTCTVRSVTTCHVDVISVTAFECRQDITFRHVIASSVTRLVSQLVLRVLNVRLSVTTSVWRPLLSVGGEWPHVGVMRRHHRAHQLPRSGRGEQWAWWGRLPWPGSGHPRACPRRALPPPPRPPCCCFCCWWSPQCSPPQVSHPFELTACLAVETCHQIVCMPLSHRLLSPGADLPGLVQDGSAARQLTLCISVPCCEFLSCISLNVTHLWSCLSVTFSSHQFMLPF